MRVLQASLLIMGCVVVAALPIAESDGNRPVPAAARGLEKDTPVSVSLRNSGEPDAVAPPYDHGPASGAPSEVHKLEAVDIQARSIAMEVKRGRMVKVSEGPVYNPKSPGPLFGFGPQGEGTGWP
ncbi:hypothetical protein CF319_g1440 [Tilletia indica]|uniref:Uncharacterized protein n=1 Tax=Tilletia walkeri TaxID=117179 RepID=A0A8X7N9Y3_9BASI|nr:hypothetical protein CF327_g5021 [Tilletia walkeri]KAE8225869.1 hypothetical protein CF319_g1440 [Tilletia indica]KAE8268674.1 hypothetical protein A4X09_0g3663 [Tilletia walkeri]